jgi:hypothetical protein
MAQPSLLTKTMDLLENCELALAQIALKSNLGVEWLRKLRAGKIPDPSVNKIQALHDFLVSPLCAQLVAELHRKRKLVDSPPTAAIP